MEGDARLKARLRQVFDRSFTEFLERERESILNGVAERHLCARLAMPLEWNAVEAGFEGYCADTEYNRNLGDRVKTIVNERMVVVPITCDLILHSRGHIAAKDNLIAIEMKRSTRPRSEKQKDQNRLIALTKSSYDGVWSFDGKVLPEHVCGYELGYFLELDLKSESFLVEEYVGGLRSSIRTIRV